MYDDVVHTVIFKDCIYSPVTASFSIAKLD